MNYLGVDFGQKQVGIALSHGTSASGILTISTAEAISRINLLCQKNNIDTCIVGLPGGRLKKTVEAFAEKLKTTISAQVFLWDETLTSYDAQNLLTQTALSTKNRHSKEHQIAASIILQSYLDSLNRKI